MQVTDICLVIKPNGDLQLRKIPVQRTVVFLWFAAIGWVASPYLDGTVSFIRSPNISASLFCSRKARPSTGAVSAQHHHEEDCSGKGRWGPPVSLSEPSHRAGLGHVAPGKRE